MNESGQKQQLHVGQLVLGDCLYGVERYTLNLVSGLAEQGVLTTVICKQEGQVADAFRKQGCRVRIIPMCGYLDFRCVKEICRIVRQEGIQVLHSHMGLDTHLGLVAARLCAIPLVASVHFVEPAYASKAAIIRGCWQLAQIVRNRFISLFLPVSDGAARQLRLKERVSPGRIYVVYPGVKDIKGKLIPKQEARELLGIDSEESVLLSIARHSYEKGLDILLEAFACIPASQRLLIIVGQGQLTDELSSLSRRLDIASRILFVPFTEQLAVYLSAADVYVQSSRQESFGMAMVEAMLAQLPVVATRTDGAATVIADEQSGLIVDRENPQALAQAITKILGDRMARQQMGEAGRSRALTCFSVKAMAQSVLSAYLTVLGGK